MERVDLQLLWEYNTWANEQILAAGRLPSAALREPVASGHGTLFGTLLHILDTEYGWRRPPRSPPLAPRRASSTSPSF